MAQELAAGHCAEGEGGACGTSPRLMRGLLQNQYGDAMVEKEMAKRRSLVEDFIKDGGVGQTIQKRLIGESLPWKSKPRLTLIIVGRARGVFPQQLAE